MKEIIIKIPEMSSETEKEIVKGIEILSKAEIARALILERLNKLLKESELTEEECIVLGREVKESMRKSLEEKGLL